MRIFFLTATEWASSAELCMSFSCCLGVSSQYERVCSDWEKPTNSEMLVLTKTLLYLFSADLARLASCSESAPSTVEVYT